MGKKLKATFISFYNKTLKHRADEKLSINLSKVLVS